MALGKLKNQRRALEYFSVWLFSFLLVNFLTRMIGGPLVSPDSHAYLGMMTAPWRFRGSWNPAGFPLVLYGLSSVGFSVLSSLGFIAATRHLLIYVMLRRRFGVLGSGLGILTFFAPEWIQVNATVWSETAFSLWIILIAFLVDSVAKPGLRITSVALILPLLFLIRHAGLFLLPAVVLSLGLLEKKGELSLSMKRLGIAIVAVLAGCLASNLLNTGSISQHMGQDASCGQGLAALSSLSYCDWGVATQLCSLDPERKWINHADIDKFSVLQTLNYSGPIRAHAATSNLCGDLKEIISYMILHRPFELVSTLAKRLIKHFGKWELTERADPLNATPKTQKRLALLDEALRISNFFQGLYVPLLVVFLLLFRLRQTKPVMVYLALGGLGHAAGIAMNNPFYVVRYLLISKMMIQLAVLLSIPIWVVQVKQLLVKRMNHYTELPNPSTGVR